MHIDSPLVRLLITYRPSASVPPLLRVVACIRATVLSLRWSFRFVIGQSNTVGETGDEFESPLSPTCVYSFMGSRNVATVTAGLNKLYLLTYLLNP